MSGGMRTVCISEILETIMSNERRSGIQMLAATNRLALKTLAAHNSDLAQHLTLGRYLVLGVRSPESIATAVVHRLMRLGGDVAITCFDQKTCDRVRAIFEPVGVSMILPCNVTDREQIASALTLLREQGWENINGIVHSIAFTKQFGSVLDADDEAIDAAVRVSALSFRTVIQTALRLGMLAPQSSSVALGYRAYANHPEREYDGAIYSAKMMLLATVHSLSQTLAREGGHRVNLASPGPIPTKAAMGIPGFPAMLERFKTESPMGSEALVTQDDVAALVAFLMSPASRYINNQDIAIDCGRD